MHDLAFIIVTYAVLVVIGMAIGAGAAELGIRLRKRLDRRTAAARLSFEQAFPIIDEWARKPGNEWYWDCRQARHFAEDECGRLMRDEPGLTVEQNLARVTNAVKQRYPEAFQTLH